MKNALEKKLQKLQAQKEALNAQIQQIEKERAQELRQLRQKKYALIGKIILTEIEAGKSISIESESDLVNLLDRHLISKADRKTFGLPYPAAAYKIVTSDNHAEDTLPPQGQKTVKPVQIKPATNAGKKTSRKRTTKTNSQPVLANTSSQSDLAKEFNL